MAVKGQGAGRFRKNSEDFICEICGFLVKGTGYTDHCPNCLWSRHVDVNPGDRASNCGGMMKPVGAEYIRGKIQIVYKCTKCGAVKKNVSAEGDNIETIMSLIGRPPVSYK
ncbi:MAG: RNHCP domain-containing protein [Candidatus Marsarchaeota archaeon]|nr:RNHCP domain-containing protein [Candidatus Marsarchaeota archaeon]MCL5112597.1 RNHCP domain-containing protein [Candidatus Marsarchaeota archaeon]